MEHSHKPVNSTKSQNEKKTAFVVLFSAATMVLEIIFVFFQNQWLCLPTVYTWDRTYWPSD